METLFQDDEGMVMVMGMGIVFLDMYARFKEAEHWISLITESEMYEWNIYITYLNIHEDSFSLATCTIITLLIS